MKKIITIILFLMPLFLMAQTAPPIVQGSKLYEFRNGLRIDSAFFIPRKDTLFFDNSMKAPGMITWRPADSTFYVYRGNRWLSIVSSAGAGLSIDSVRRSNDTLFFRYTTGGELAVKIAGLPISAVVNLTDSLAAQTLQTVTAKGNNTPYSIGIGVTSPVAKVHVVSTTEQLRLGYDLSNYLSIGSVNSTGSFLINAVGSNGNRTITITPATLFPAGITAGTEATNLYIGSVTAPFLTSNYRYLFGGSTSVQGNVGMISGGANLLSSNVSYGYLIIGGMDVTTPVSGTNNIITSLVVKQPNVIPGGATVNTLTSSYFNNIATNGFSIFSDTGLVKINDTLIVRRIRATGNVKFTKGLPGIGKGWIDTSGQGDGAWQTITSGTVTSVGLTAPSIFSVSGSPVTSTGTLALTFATGQTANQVLASPDGTTGAVSLRSLTSTDIPSLDVAKITTGVFSTARLGTGSGGAGAKFLRDDGTYSNVLAGPFTVSTGAVIIQAGSLTATSTGGSQFGGGYDGSNKWVASTGSTGITSFTASGSAPLFIFNQLTAFGGGISTNSGSANASNFGAAGGGAGTTGIGTAGLLWGGASTVATKAWFNGTTSTVAGATDNISNVIFGNGGFTTAASGFIQYAANVVITRPAITIGTANYRYGGSLIIDDSTNTAMFNNSLLIRKGSLRMFGRIIFGLTGLGDPGDSVVVKGGADSIGRVVSSNSWIKNSNAAAQTGRFWINGSARIDSTIRYTYGNPGSGKILVDSTGTGIAVWRTPSTSDNNIPLKDIYTAQGNSSSTPNNYTALHTFNVAANTITANGQKILMTSGGVYSATVGTKDLQVFINGNGCGTFLSTSVSDGWQVDVFFVRTGTTTGTVVVRTTGGTALSDAITTDLTGLDYTGAITFAVWGASGTGTINDVTAKLTRWVFEQAAP